MVKNAGFRAWYYFRNGWATYFAFIFAAINTLTVTYYLAIENIPELKTIFPTFSHYIIITTLIGIPLLTLIGYIHFKRSIAYRAETEISYESNPFARRTLVNTELMMKLNLHLTRLLIKLNQNEKLTEKELIELTSLQDNLNEFLSERTFANDKDLDYIKNLKKS